MSAFAHLFRRGTTALLVLAATTLGAASVQAQEWGEIANISSTMGVSGSRICIGEASRGDIGCPAYAPTVSPTGNVGITAGLTVNSVSLTTAGTTWGYLGSAASYIPNLNTNNISLSTINGVSVTNLGGASPTNVPAFLVHRNNVDQTITANGYTKVVYTTKTFDIQNNFNTSTSRFTPTVAGRYIFTANGWCTGAGSRCSQNIYKNGALVVRGTVLGQVAQAVAILELNGTTDYVENYVDSDVATLSGAPNHTFFSGSLLASGNGLISGTGAGVSAMSSLTDVTLTSPAANSILVYDGSKWVNKFVQDTVSSTSMVTGWPDAIMCNVSNPAFGMIPFYAAYTPYSSDGKYYYRANIQNGTAYTIAFTSAGAFDSYQSITTTNCNTTISSLYSQGRAFNFLGGNGSGSNALGDRLTSGTLAVTANSTTAVVSLSTAGTTWGYLSSAASYLPNLSTNALNVGGLNITSSTLTSTTAQVAFSVNKNGTNQTVSTGTWAKLTWSTKEYDTNNNFDTATSRFTPTIPGYYFVSMQAYCADSTAYCYGAIYKNGSARRTLYIRSSNNSASPVNDIVYMNGTTDYLEAYTNNSGGTTIGGASSLTWFSGALLNGGSGGSGGAGVSAMSSLTDVTLTSPAANSILVYDGSKWVNKFVQDTVSSSTMVNGWPDAIVCTDTGGSPAPTGRKTVLTQGFTESTGRMSYQWSTDTAVVQMTFNADGSYYTTYQGSSTDTFDCQNKSISTLYAEGKAFNFIGGSGTGSTALGDRLTSGTLAVTANSATSIISLSTAGTTWGYLGSSASYLPNLSTNALTLNGLTLTSSSLVSSTAQVAFSVHKNGTNQTIAGSTPTLMTFSTKDFDTSNSFNTSTNRFTPTVPGKYLVRVSAHCGTGAYCQVFIYKNGAGIQTGYGRSNVNDVYGSVSMLVDMNGSTDYLEAYVQIGSGTVVSGGPATTRFEVILINGGSGGSGGGTSDRIVSGSTSVIANTAGTVAITAPVQVSGSVNFANNPGEACNSGNYGSVKQVGGRLVVCRQ